MKSAGKHQGFHTPNLQSLPILVRDQLLFLTVCYSLEPSSCELMVTEMPL